MPFGVTTKVSPIYQWSQLASVTGATLTTNLFSFFERQFLNWWYSQAMPYIPFFPYGWHAKSFFFFQTFKKNGFFYYLFILNFVYWQQKINGISNLLMGTVVYYISMFRFCHSWSHLVQSIILVRYGSTLYEPLWFLGTLIWIMIIF